MGARYMICGFQLLPQPWGEAILLRLAHKLHISQPIFHAHQLGQVFVCPIFSKQACIGRTWKREPEYFDHGIET